MHIQFKEMNEKDIDNLIPIMKLAYDYDIKVHLDKEVGGLHGYDDGAF